VIIAKALAKRWHTCESENVDSEAPPRDSRSPARERMNYCVNPGHHFAASLTHPSCGVAAPRRITQDREQGLHMRFPRTSAFGAFAGVLLLALCTLAARQSAQGELHWPALKKQSVRVRLVALAWNHPRSSFFSSEEVFIAEKQLGGDESRLVKLVYGFLPYQPRLSDSRFDYSDVLELRAVRDPGCDETLLEMTTGRVGDWRQQESGLKYSVDAPPLNLQRRKSTLPCYVTTPEDYRRSVRQPPPFEPVFSKR
jgi:hypothetical protein